MNLNYLIEIAKEEGIERLNVAVVLMNQDHKILICQRAKNKKYLPNVWHIPGGKIEEGETVEATAKREIKEELNLNLDEIICDTEIIHNYIGHGGLNSRTVFILGKASGKIQLDFENQNYAFISTDEIEQYFEPHVAEINTQVFQKALNYFKPSTHYFY